VNRSAPGKPALALPRLVVGEHRFVSIRSRLREHPRGTSRSGTAITPLLCDVPVAHLTRDPTVSSWLFKRVGRDGARSRTRAYVCPRRACEHAYLSPVPRRAGTRVRACVRTCGRENGRTCRCVRGRDFDSRYSPAIRHWIEFLEIPRTLFSIDVRVARRGKRAGEKERYVVARTKAIRSFART